MLKDEIQKQNPKKIQLEDGIKKTNLYGIVIKPDPASQL